MAHGYHRFYTEDQGWVVAADLTIGEKVRGVHADLTVTGRVLDPGRHRVYNITVESDHDYYVGSLDALVHNWCGYQDHHIIPRYLGGSDDPANIWPRLQGDLHEDLHDLIDEGLQDLFWDNQDAPWDRFDGEAAWSKFFADNQGTQQQAWDLVEEITQNFFNGLI